MFELMKSFANIVYDNCGKGEGGGGGAGKGVVDGNHHRIVVLTNPAQPAPPSEVENNLPIEMHWFNIELIKY